MSMGSIARSMVYIEDLSSVTSSSYGTGRVSVKAQGMEGGHGEERVESQHEED